MEDYVISEETSQEQIDNMVEQHRYDKLREIAEDFNREASREARINLKEYDNSEDLILTLWARQVDIPDVLTFGEPYDEVFRDMAFDTDENEDPVYDTNHSHVGILFHNWEAIPDYLFYSLSLPYGGYISNHRYANNMDKFNKIWLKLPISEGIPLKSYADFRQWLLSGQLSKYDLIYLVWEANRIILIQEQTQISALFVRIGQWPINWPTDE